MPARYDNYNLLDRLGPENVFSADFLSTVDQSRGKFRTFLRACCQHFLANHRAFARAQKRGGARPLLSLDFHGAAERYRAEPASGETAEKLLSAGGR